jgi:hypothetical protein
MKRDGCHISGYIEVSKVSGKLQFSLLHRAHVHPDGRLHDETSKKMNFSHVINHLSFGEKYSGISNPLDNTHEAAPQEHYNYQYFLSVVPTIFTKAAGLSSISTYQFAVTNYSDPIDDQDRYGSSGIYLSYSFEPISVKIDESSNNFIHFLVRTCAILGGVFTSTKMVTRLVDAFASFRK